jgi:predicted RNA-binding Zn-ribbon protein involved in translation (DUF1610 family)
MTEKQIFAVGDRVEQICPTCGEERGHIVASATKKGRPTRVTCSVCGARTPYKRGTGDGRTRTPIKAGAPYDMGQTYRRGQTMTHPTFGVGEVTAIIEPRKIDVLFADRVRRLIHSHVQN